MYVSLGDTIDLRFFTHNGSGALTDADSTPTVDWSEDGAAASTTGVTVTNVTTGKYKATIVCSGANGFEAGKWYEVAVTATVGAVASAQRICGFQLRATPTVEGTPLVEVASYASGQAPLQPTVAGRTLDVTTTGEAGIDWANIGAPTTAQNLSGTSTKALEPTVAGRTLDVSAGGEAGLDWANIGSPTTTQNLTGTLIKSWMWEVALPQEIEVPSAATRTYRIDFALHKNLALTNADAAPTIGVVNQVGSSLNARLDATTMSAISTGLYRTIYTSTAGDAAAELEFTITAVIDGFTVTKRFAALVTTISADAAAGLTSVIADTDDIQARLPAALGANGNMKADIRDILGTATPAPTVAGIMKAEASGGSITSVTGNVGGNVTGSVGSVAAGGITASSIADNTIDRATFAQDAKDLFGEVRRFTAAGGSTTTVTFDAGAVATDNYYNRASLLCVGGAGSGQTAGVASYVGATKIATLDATVATAFDNTSVFELRASGGASSSGGGGGFAQIQPNLGPVMLKQGATGDARNVYFSLVDSTGARLTGKTGADMVITVAVPDGSSYAAAGGTVTEVGNGDYYYLPSAGELDTTGNLMIHIEPNDATISPFTIGAQIVGFDPGDLINGIVDAFMAYSHDTGLTIKGSFRRLDALLAGKATGLKGAIARFFMRDGTTAAITATQDTAAGTRSAASVTGSEA